MKLLYVEDDPKDADLARRALKKSTPEIVLELVGTYQEAITRLDQVSDYDLVLTDLKLPDGDGLSLLSHIRTKGLPCAVVVISGKGDEETAVAALKSGADDYLVKHGDYLKSLPLTMENALQRHHAEIDLRARPLRVLYGEHHTTDIDLTRRHLAKYAPFIRLEVVNTPPEIKQRISDAKARKKYDVILLDYSLPGLNTLDLIKEMVQVDRVDVPIVLVTGQGSEEVAAQAIKLGAVDYVVKNPGYLFQLPGLLENAFHRAQLLREQTALRESEQKFRGLVEQSSEGIVIVDEQGLVVEWNRGQEQMSGLKRADVLGKPMWDAQFQMVPDDMRTPAVRERLEINILDLMKTGNSQRLEQPVETIIQLPDGTRRMAEIVVYQFKTSKGFMVGSISRDITDRKQAEEKLAASEAELRALFASMQDMVLVIDHDGIIRMIAPTNPALLYRPPEYLLNKNLTDNFPSEQAENFLNAIRQVLKTGQTEHIEYEMKINEDTLWFSAFITQMTADSTVWVARDVTEARRAEEKIALQIRRMNALHSIDASIAGNFDIRVTLNVFLEHVVSQLGVDAATILLLNQGTQLLTYAAGRGFRSRINTNLRFQIGEDYAGKVALQRRLVSIADLTVHESPLSKTGITANEGFVSYYGVPLIAKGQVIGVLEIFHRSRLEPDSDWLSFLDTLAGQAAIAIDNAQLFDNLQSANLNLAVAYDATIEGWSRALDLRDEETEGHTQRVTELSLQLATHMGIYVQDQVHFRRGALLHDIGKMGVPDNILRKPGSLSEDEWVIMRKHPQFAYDMLFPILYLRPAIDIPYCHHEKWDGSGYPRGLKGEQIPLAGRIFAVVDVYDALLSDRPYRKAWSREKAVEHIKAGAGTHFDPKVTDAFLRLITSK